MVLAPSQIETQIMKETSDGGDGGSASPASVIARTETLCNFPQAVPSSTLSAEENNYQDGTYATTTKHQIKYGTSYRAEAPRVFALLNKSEVTVKAADICLTFSLPV